MMEGLSSTVSPVVMDANSASPSGNETLTWSCSGLAYRWLTVSIVWVSFIRSTGILYLLLDRQPAGTDKGQRSTSNPMMSLAIAYLILLSSELVVPTGELHNT